MKKKKESSSPLQINCQIVPFLCKIIFAQTPPSFQCHLQDALSNFSLVLLRQKQLSCTKFICDSSFELKESVLEDICSRFDLEREEIDPDRLIWLSLETLAKYLIRPGQWVSLSKFEVNHDVKNLSSVSEDFKCRVAPLPPTASSVPSNSIGMSRVAEYNLRKSLNIPPFLTLPPFRLKPILTNPIIKAPNQSLTFSPIYGKSVKLTRLKSSREVSAHECDILIEDVYSVNCKYLCVGDIISVQLSGPHESLTLTVSEINGKRKEDECKELFKVTRGSSSVSLSSSQDYNQFHLKLDEANLKRCLPPCLSHQYLEIFGWMRQALIISHNFKKSKQRHKETEVVSEIDSFDLDKWPNILLYGPIGSGKLTVCQTLASAFGLNFHFVNGTNLVGDTSAYIEGNLKALYDKVSNSLCPGLIYIKNVHIVGTDKDGNEDKRAIIAFKEFIRDCASLSLNGNSILPHEKKDVMTSTAIFIIGSTDSPAKLQSSVGQSFLYKKEFPPTVSTSEMVETLEWLFDKSGVELQDDLELKDSCKGLQRSYGDLKALAATVVRNAFSRTTLNSSKVENDEFKINYQDLGVGLKTIEAVLKKASSTVEVPKVSWDDIGGLQEIKSELINSVKLPLEFPHLFGSGVRRSGILLYGPPGTGKTLIAKAVATEFKLSFLSVKGPELLNMYVGQSEQNVRDVFAKARQAAPCIVFFDELDALAPNRGRAGDSGGVMDRVVSQILAELDGTHSSTGVFVIGATNRPDLIDPALLRPGRFDKMLYVGISQDNESKTAVLKALTRKFRLEKDVDLLRIASLLPNGMSGADIYSLCSDAYMTAIERNISLLSDGQKPDLEVGVMVNNCDFEIALSRVTPSLSKAEQAKYEALNNYMKQ